MSSYPFDKVWHHGRGITFMATTAGVVRSDMTSTQSRADNSTNNIDPEPEESEDDNESFTTAPEYDDDQAPPGANAATDPAATEASLLPKIPLPAPPQTNLDYNVCKVAFEAAQRAQPGSKASYWSHKLYRGPEGLDGAARHVTVHYCTSKHTMERVSQYFLDEPVLGFDLEWFPQATKLSSPRMNCSLIQIASPSRIALFHVAVFPEKDDLVSPTFRRIMEDPDVSKVGVNIKADCTRMRRCLEIGTRGIFELSHLYKLVKFSPIGRADLVNKRLASLGSQVQECLALPLYKGDDVRNSDWTKRLTIDQTYYAAADAYAGIQLYHVLDERRQALRPTPPLPYHAELNKPIRLAKVVDLPVEDAVPDQVDASDVNLNTKTTAKISAGNPLCDSSVSNTIDACNEMDVPGQA